jgi:hypothetical protein
LVSAASVVLRPFSTSAFAITVYELPLSETISDVLSDVLSTV